MQPGSRELTLVHPAMQLRSPPVDRPQPFRAVSGSGLESHGKLSGLVGAPPFFARAPAKLADLRKLQWQLSHATHNTPSCAETMKIRSSSVPSLVNIKL